MHNKKKKILLDLDGVLNTYSGDYNAKYIPPIKDGAVEFLQKLSKEFEVKIFTVRNIELAKQWIDENNLSIYISGVTNSKEPA